MPTTFKRSGQNYLFVGIFLSFLIMGLVNSKWEASSVKDWREFDSSFSSTERKTEAPYIKNIGDIDADGYSDILIFDGPEKAICINQNSEYDNIDLFPKKDQFIDESINILESNKGIELYGRSSIGVYTINKENQDDFIWENPYSDRDIQKCEVINDMNGDGVKDIFVSFGLIKLLPDLALYGFENYIDLFRQQHGLFKERWIIENTSDTILVTPKYTEFQTIVLSGIDGSTLIRNDLEKFNYNRSVIDVVELNKTNSGNEQNEPSLILLSTNISTVRFMSPIYHNKPYLGKEILNHTDIYPFIYDYENSTKNNFDFQIHAISLSPMKTIWTLNSSSLPDLVVKGIDTKLTTFGIWEEDVKEALEKSDVNCSLNDVHFIDIESFGTQLIIKFHVFRGAILFFDDENRIPFLDSVGVFSVFNSSTGENMWFGNTSVNYLSKNIDLDGDGFGQINGYFLDESTNETAMLLYNPKNGEIISKALLPNNSSRLFNKENFDSTVFSITDDDKMGDDGIFEIMTVSIDKSHYNNTINPNHLNESDPIQMSRINLNQSSVISMLLSKIQATRFNIESSTERLEISSTNVDFDNDGWLDYIFFSNNITERRIESENMEESVIRNESVLISGKCSNLNDRNLPKIFSMYSSPHNYSDEYNYSSIDRRTFNEKVFFFQDSNNPERISIINSNTNEITYIQDINTFESHIKFTDFFEGAKVLIYLLELLLLMCGIGILKGFKKVSKRADKKTLLSTGVRISVVIMVVMITIIQYFFTTSIDLTIGYTDVAVSPEGKLIWFVLLYPIIFVMFALIPGIYNKTAPFFAEHIYIKSQKFLFKLKKKKKEYKIIVINMKERNKVSIFTRLKRMLLPLLISFTIGTFIYQGLGIDGGIYNLIGPSGTNFINKPLTNPNALGVITEEMVHANEIWIELGRFAQYCIVPMIIMFFFTAIIIPSAWILDDSGICFYQRAIMYRQISDIDSVSKFFLNVISGLFGFTAIVSFFSLFLPMLTKIDELMLNLSILTDQSVVFAVGVLILSLIIFPLFSSGILLFIAMYEMESDYENNVKKMHKRLNKLNISTTPLDLSSVLEAKTEEWFDEENTR